MASNSGYLLGILLLVLSLLCKSSQAHPIIENRIKIEEFQSPKFVLEPGLVSNKYYYDIDFPRGHIAIKSFNAEVIDDDGNQIPLHETYLHHWVVFRYYQRKGVSVDNNRHGILKSSDHIMVKNSGVCDFGLTQYFGLGSETRKTPTDIPDPFGIEVGDKADVPEGFEEKWMLNVHAIDTRGAEDRMGCTECRCDLYNVTKRSLPDNYNGGLRCCRDDSRCRLKPGYQGVRRSLYLSYTVKYVDWSDSIVPVKIYILDVTDLWTKGDESRGFKTRHRCLIEYDVESCHNVTTDESCTDTRTLKLSSPINGELVYGVGHQHSGGTGIALYGEGGREICASIPSYGQGFEPGNESGYIVGMSTCYPSTGSMEISHGETLTLVSNYSSTQTHTGVMGLFYLLVVDDSPKSVRRTHFRLMQVHGSVMKSDFVMVFAPFVAAVVMAAVFMLWGGGGSEREGYDYEPVAV